MNPAAVYWEMGVQYVPAVTGALALLDGQDMPGLAADLGFELPLVNVLDVGCGTGRIAKHCNGYTGVDISRDAVVYCLRAGLKVNVVDGPASLQWAPGTFGWVTCMSVFTHIPETERIDYLQRFKMLAPSLLVDIIPGDGDGDVALWTARPDMFEWALQTVGYEIVATTERKAGAGDYVHRYYHGRMHRARA